MKLSYKIIIATLLMFGVLAGGLYYVTEKSKGHEINLSEWFKGTSNHKLDGVYITSKSFLGFAGAWVIDGERIITYPENNESITCKQYADRIEFIDGRIYRVDKEGCIIISKGKKDISIGGMNLDIDVDMKMVKVSNKTDLTVDEIQTILNTSYEK